VGKRKKRRNRLSTPSASPSDWKASILEWLDGLDDADLPEGLTKEDARQAIDQLANTARPDGKGGWTVEVPW